MYLRYKEMIESHSSIDYWADVLSEDAIEVLNNFNNSDWEKLNEEVVKFSKDSQEKVAETLSEAITDSGINILLKLLTFSDSKGVLEATIDSLNSIYQQKDKVYLTEAQRHKVKSLSKENNLASIPAKNLLSIIRLK